jgi:hypothetical protein
MMVILHAVCSQNESCAVEFATPPTVRTPKGIKQCFKSEKRNLKEKRGEKEQEFNKIKIKYGKGNLRQYVHKMNLER